MTKFNETSKTSEKLLNAHKDFLNSITELSEGDYLDYIYNAKTPETKQAMINHFRSFDDAKKEVIDIPMFDELLGFTSEYKDFMHKG